MKIVIQALVILSMPFSVALAESDPPKVDLWLQLDTARVIEDGPFSKSVFERDRYFRSYGSLGQFSDERHAELETIGAVPGRGTFRLYVEPDADPDRIFTEESIQRTVDHRDLVYQRAGERAPNLEHALAHGPYLEWMRVGHGPPPEGVALEDWERQSHGNILRSEFFEPVADVIVRWYEEMKKNDLHFPRYYTVQNEPLTSWNVEEFSRYTRIVAERMSAAHPDVQVAGPCLAWPYPTGNWSSWRNWQSRFIDLAGDAVDAYDLHFYSKGHWALPRDDRWQAQRVESPFLLENRKQGNTTVWDFGRLPGYLDLWTAHHLDVWGGETKPMIVSEFGRQTIYPQFGPWVNDFWPWLYMTTVTRMWMVFMDRPEVQLTIPFILPESQTAYAPQRGQAIYTRLNMPESRDLSVTRFREFYDFFRDLDGIRIPHKVMVADADSALNERLFVLSLREGNRTYLLIHNGGRSLDDTMTIRLNAVAGGERRIPRKTSVKRLYYEGPIPEPEQNEEPASGNLFIAGPDDYETLESPELTLRGEEIAIVRLDFDDDLPAMTHTRREVRHYSRKTLIGFNGEGLAEADIDLSNTLPTNLRSGTLHLGLARDDGFNQNPTVTFNGIALLEIDLSHSAGVTDYHAPSVLEIPSEVIRNGSNRVRVAFPEEIEGGSPYLVSLRLDLVTRQEETLDR